MLFLPSRELYYRTWQDDHHPALGNRKAGWGGGHQEPQDLRHSGNMHFSTCSSSSLQSPSSARDLSIRWRVRMPFPQVTLQSLHSDHGDSKQGMVSRPRARFAPENRLLLPSLLSLSPPSPVRHFGPWSLVKGTDGFRCPKGPHTAGIGSADSCHSCISPGGQDSRSNSII